jgi:hypothetical protein
VLINYNGDWLKIVLQKIKFHTANRSSEPLIMTAFYSKYDQRFAKIVDLNYVNIGLLNSGETHLRNTPPLERMKWGCE